MTTTGPAFRANSGLFPGGAFLYVLREGEGESVLGSEVSALNWFAFRPVQFRRFRAPCWTWGWEPLKGRGGVSVERGL